MSLYCHFAALETRFRYNPPQKKPNYSRFFYGADLFFKDFPTLCVDSEHVIWESSPTRAKIETVSCTKENGKTTQQIFPGETRHKQLTWSGVRVDVRGLQR